MTEELSLETIRDRLFDYLTSTGACAVGGCNQEGLVGGPPSTDLTRELDGAVSAINFAIPQDEAKIELYMGKIEHAPYQEEYIHTNNVTHGLAFAVADMLINFGFESEAINAGNTGSGGDTRDISPKNDYQRQAAEGG